MGGEKRRVFCTRKTRTSVNMHALYVHTLYVYVQRIIINKFKLSLINGNAGVSLRHAILYYGCTYSRIYAHIIYYLLSE